MIQADFQDRDTLTRSLLDKSASRWLRCLVLTTYLEIRDRIYELARRSGLRPDWVESTRETRALLLYDAEVVVARATVPLRRLEPDTLTRLAHDLEMVFGKDWME